MAVSTAAASPLGKIADLHIARPASGGFAGSSEIHDRIPSVAPGHILFDSIVLRRPDLLATAVPVDDLFDEDRL